jgi:hypothetical protein
MADENRATTLTELLGRLGDVERWRFRESTGIDIEHWKIDKARFSAFETSLDDYRKALVEAVELAGAVAGSQQAPQFRCDCCGATELESDYSVNVPKCVTLCAECTNVLVEHVHNGR